MAKQRVDLRLGRRFILELDKIGPTRTAAIEWCIMWHYINPPPEDGPTYDRKTWEIWQEAPPKDVEYVKRLAEEAGLIVRYSNCPNCGHLPKTVCDLCQSVTGRERDVKSDGSH